MKDESIHEKNNRVRHIKVKADGRDVCEAELEDLMGEQIVVFDQPVSASVFRVTIVDVYPEASTTIRVSR